MMTYDLLLFNDVPKYEAQYIQIILTAFRKYIQVALLLTILRKILTHINLKFNLTQEI